MNPTPAALAYLREINRCLGGAWALKLAAEIKAGTIHSIDGKPCLQAPVQITAKADRPRRQERFTI